jgi:hypothetical protein
MNTQTLSRETHARPIQTTLQSPQGLERRFLPDGTEVTGTRLHAEGAPIHLDRFFRLRG